MRRGRRPANQLRAAIDCLPPDTRTAMLDGVEANRIIVGAYVDRQGGVCPMLAAHRHGGRTALASFARAWDRYTGAGSGPRPASDRELRTLRTMLEASIAVDSGGESELGQAIAAFESSRERTGAARESASPRQRPPLETGELDRTEELRRRPGWAWLRPYRRLDEYEQALAELRAMEREEHGAQRDLV